MAPGETMRVFPLSNWTELDVWTYIHAENIPIVPLYYAAPRPIVRRSGMLIFRDDDRMKLESGEKTEELWVRFRTMGDWPLTAAHESGAESIDEVIAEIRSSRVSERAGRRHRPGPGRVHGTKEKRGLLLMGTLGWQVNARASALFDLWVASTMASRR